MQRHNEDANAAQCELINALFRSVGGQSSCEIDPATHNLQNIDDDQWATLITNVVADMQIAQDKQVLVTATKKPSSKQAAAFLNQYKTLWFQVADAALTSGTGATSSDASNSDAPTAARLDVGLVRELLNRVIEVRVEA